MKLDLRPRLRPRLRLCYGALGLNFVVWLINACFTASYFATVEVSLNLMPFLWPLAFLGAFLGVFKRIRGLYLLSLPFLLLTAVVLFMLVLYTAQPGTAVLLVLDLLAVVLLVTLWRPIMHREAAGT